MLAVIVLAASTPINGKTAGLFFDANDDRLGTGVACSPAADVNSDCLLRVHDKISDDQLSITGKRDTGGSSINWLTFNSRGLPKDGSASSSGVFSVCRYLESDGSLISRAVVLGLPGRVRISDSANVNCPPAA